MRYRETVDPFWKKQPQTDPGKELKEPLHKAMPHHWNKRAARADEVYIAAASCVWDFPDKEGLLQTAYDDFALFMRMASIRKGTFEMRTKWAETPCFEAYRIIISDTSVTIEAADTEGVRRALVYIEDEMLRRDGSFLPIGTIARAPKIADRISHSFFSSKEDELGTPQDRYPAEYLNRLAHDGINGLWIAANFPDLVPSAIIPAYGEAYKPRIDALNAIIAKCRRYGIKIYVEGVEPSSTYQNAVLKKHGDMLGASFWGGAERALCISTPKGRAYIEECTKTLFTLAPGLAGMVTISIGEKVAGCGSVATKEPMSCPHCKAEGLTKPQAVALYEKALVRGIRAAGSNAKLISWTYAARGWSEEMLEEYCNAHTDDSIHMANFEDGGILEQVGKKRKATDYWLSYAGPGKIFETSAAIAEKRGNPIYAKIQVCNSHEIASVPYVPTPGILYDKFRYMHTHGVTGTVCCWYFGNYSCLMNKAAGELAFSPYFDSKQAFLEHLAGVYWGSDVSTVVQAWTRFEEGYTSFPLNVAFEWYGPMTDGVVWPLHLQPVDLPPSSNWLLQEMVGSDRMGDWVAMGHTPREAYTLCKAMSAHWRAGELLLCDVPDDGEEQKLEQKRVARAIGYLLESGENILHFYLLRDELGRGEGEPRDILAEMRAIVLRETENSKQLSLLCESDTRLGYHNEAEGYKFFPNKLRWRVKQLQTLLETEFPAVSAAIDTGETPLPFYRGEDAESKRYEIAESEIEKAVWDSFEGGTSAKIRIAQLQDTYILQLLTAGKTIRIDAEFQLFQPYIGVTISNDEVFLNNESGYYLLRENEPTELQKWRLETEHRGEHTLYTLRLNRSDFGLHASDVFRMGIQVDGNASWGRDDRIFHRLIGTPSPDAKVFIIPIIPKSK